MPRPKTQTITFSIDGREVQAPENMMLVDAAKLGDVEIPVFCYEPKLGAPVGACRMCLVEIEGMPKLQTACSTAVKDGMVVHSRSERAQVAQQAVVEFLLINHPLDCPVCDKGGECPLQDITYGWGGGISRFIEPKRHFRKPLELSPLIAIDRERCILCYRCVRYSQEVAEDYQLVLLERGEHSFVGTFDGHPYVAPFSGNIIELCPVGALTSRPYRFRARPWDIEGAGSICTLCPAQCNTTLTVRDERVMRVLTREHHEVDDGWLCDKGRFAYQAVHVDERITAPMIRDGGELRTVSWERAMAEATGGLRRAGSAVAALAGGGATNEEGLLLARLLRDVIGSPHLASSPGAAVSLAHWRALSDPTLAASVSDLEFAHAVLVLDCEPVDDAPILELRIRKGVRRGGVRLFVASARPSALDPLAGTSLRFAPGRGSELVWALVAALRREPVEQAAAAAGVSVAAVRELARGLREAGKEVVVLYGEQVLDGDSAALVALADALGLPREGAGLLGIPSEANGRGLREAGVMPGAGPGLTRPAGGAGSDAPAIARALGKGDLSAIYLLGVDPVFSYPEGRAWQAALEHATTVIAHASFLTPGIREHATVVFPSESSAEKEGTITHPDGRVQRLRPAIGHVGEVRAEWRVLLELARALGSEIGPAVAAALSADLFATVGLYKGLTLTRLAGHGIRWPAEPGSPRSTSGEKTSAKPKLRRPHDRQAETALLGSYRSIWAGPEVSASPALSFLAPLQRVELCPADAVRLGLRHDEAVIVDDGHAEVRARVALRDSAPGGTAFLERSLNVDGANVLHGSHVRIRSVQSVEAEAAALLSEQEAAQAAGEGELRESEVGA